MIARVLMGVKQKGEIVMRIASTIARYLLGIIFLVFGLNGFLHFIPTPPPEGLAGQFMGVLFASHFFVLIFGVQVIGAVLLLANRFVPLALTILAPVIANILTFHVLMAPSGLPPAILVTVLWSLIFVDARTTFAVLFQSRFQPRVSVASNSN